MGARLERTDVLLVGGGVASARCARSLRRHGFGGSILLVGNEPRPPYNRPPLSKELLRDDLPDELVLAEPESWYRRRSVELRVRAGVTALDPAARMATLSDGTRVAFDRCLIATGAEPRRLAIQGAERALVLRTIEDSRRIRQVATAVSRAVIVGGGFIGVEVASSLATLGVDVTVVELAPNLWGGLLGSELAGWARAQLEHTGVRVMTGSRAEAVHTGAVRVDGDAVPADLVVAGIGVVPRDELARAAGLPVADGVVTDARHETSAKGIFAAGDVARVDGRRVEHWHAAREGGERAALAMLDLPLPAARAPWVFSEVAGHQLDVVGSASTWEEVRRIGDDRRFALAYVVEGHVVQVAIVDGALPVEEARALVERTSTVDEVERLFRRGDADPGG